ncbi:MAG: class I SAM-dependent methyltransferase [Acidiferrobacterales bacterium]
MTDPDFDQVDYWTRRISGDIDLGVVGHRSLGRAYNEYIYRRRAVVLRDAIEELGLEPAGSKVLDVGAGSGYYVDFWRALGVPALVGIDLSREGMERLAAKYPEYRFLCADVTSPSISAAIDSRFSVITVFDVIYHITDDDAAQRAFNSISEMLERDGYLLVFDHIMGSDYALRQHVKYRGEQHYAEMLHRASLEIVGRRPLFVFLEPPVIGHRSADVLISGIYCAAGMLMRRWNRLGSLAGRLVYRLDDWFSRSGVKTANHELLIIKKRADSGP